MAASCEASKREIVGFFSFYKFVYVKLIDLFRRSCLSPKLVESSHFYPGLSVALS